MILVGHSAGGVVARTALVRGHYDNIKALITIASPHLGTSRAEQALDATDIPFPFSLVTDFFGGGAYHTAMRSRSLYVELVRPQPGKLLYWLNAQRHPEIKYVSIVLALQGRSTLVNVPVSHGLEPIDGSAIAQLLSDLEL